MRRVENKIPVLVVFGAIFVLLFAGFAAFQGLSGPSVPSGDVAFVDDVDDGGITQEDFDAAIAQSAAAAGVRGDPPTEGPQFEQLRDDALGSLILGKWVAGEAEERGIEVSDSEVASQLEQTKEQSFENERDFQRFLRQQRFDDEDVNQQIRLGILSDRITSQITEGQPEVSDDAIEAFYEENRQQFEQPESRNVRQVLNRDRAEVERAMRELEGDDSSKSWRKVAKDVSSDRATKDRGGLLEGVIQGQSEPPLDQAIFAAAEGELVGPIETDRGFAAVQVQEVTPAQTTSLDQVRDQIRQQIATTIQQQDGTDFNNRFTMKWRSRTVCAEGFVIAQCSNFPAPEIDEDELLSQEDGVVQPPVTSRRVFAPGTAGTTPPQDTQQLITPPAQGGIPPQGAVPANPPEDQGLPPGAVPVGPDGAPQQGAPPPPQGGATAP